MCFVFSDVLNEICAVRFVDRFSLVSLIINPAGIVHSQHAFGSMSISEFIPDLQKDPHHKFP